MDKIVRNKLFEDPDMTYAKGDGLTWDEEVIPAYPFGVNIMRSEIMVGPNHTTHDQIKSSSTFAYEDYQGRIWPTAGIIAFWEAPTKTLLLHIFKKLINNPRLEKYNIQPEDIRDFLFDIPNPDLSSNDEDAILTYSEYPDNPKIEYRSTKFEVKQRPQHTISPLKKKKEDQPKGGYGSEKYAKKKPLAWRQAMQNEGLITENPNAIYIRDEGTHRHWDKMENIVFSKYDDDVVYSVYNYPGEQNTHYSLYSDLLYSIKDKDKIQKIVKSEICAGRGPSSGRIFPTEKIITFWNFPKNKKEFQDVIKQLDDKYKLGIDNTWEVEIPSEYNIPTKYKNTGWGDWYPNEDSQYFIPVDKYKGGYERPKEEIEREHEKSPLLKKKKKVPSGVGSKKYGERKPLVQRQTMYAESVHEHLLNENPNAIIDPKEWEKYKDKPSHTPSKIEYDAEGVIPFGYYGDPPTLITGTSKQTHMHLLNKAKKIDLIKTAGQFKERGRNSGRLFTNQKVISFWNFPKDYNELNKVIKDLETKLNIKISQDPEWKIEIPSGEFKNALDQDVGSWGSWHPRIGQVKYIPINQYKGGYKRSEDEMGQEHIKSPLLKKKKSIGSWGSGKPRGLERLKMQYSMGENFYPRLK